MAKYFAGFLSPISNKLGNAVGRKWRNLDVLAVYQPKVKNPRTSAQTAQRNKLSVISNMAQGLNNIIKLGFETVCKGTKVFPRAKFISSNIKSVNGTDMSITWANILVAMGGLVRPNFSQATALRPETIDVKFSYGVLDAQYRDISPDDVKVYAVAYEPKSNTSILSHPASFDQGAVSISTPSDWNGLLVQVWGFAVYQGNASAIDGLRSYEASPSVYLGEVTVQ